MEESKRSKFRRICVFCGSNSGRRKVFRDAALELGNELCFYSGVSELGHGMGFANIICHAYEIRVLAERHRAGSISSVNLSPCVVSIRRPPLSSRWP